MSQITQEVVNVRSDTAGVRSELAEVKKDISELKDQEVDIINGNNIPVSVKRDDVIVKSYHLLKPGGYLDKRIEEVNDTWQESHEKCRAHQIGLITKCQEDHTPQAAVGRFNKAIKPWETAGRTVLWIIAIGVFVFSIIYNKEDRKKQNEDLKDSIKKELKIELEKTK